MLFAYQRIVVFLFSALRESQDTECFLFSYGYKKRKHRP